MIQQPKASSIKAIVMIRVMHHEGVENKHQQYKPPKCCKECLKGNIKIKLDNSVREVIASEESTWRIDILLALRKAGQKRQD